MGETHANNYLLILIYGDVIFSGNFSLLLWSKESPFIMFDSQEVDFRDSVSYSVIYWLRKNHVKLILAHDGWPLSARASCQGVRMKCQRNIPKIPRPLDPIFTLPLENSSSSRPRTPFSLWVWCLCSLSPSLSTYSLIYLFTPIFIHLHIYLSFYLFIHLFSIYLFTFLLFIYSFCNSCSSIYLSAVLRRSYIRENLCISDVLLFSFLSFFFEMQCRLIQSSTSHYVTV